MTITVGISLQKIRSLIKYLPYHLIVASIAALSLMPNCDQVSSQPTGHSGQATSISADCGQAEFLTTASCGQLSSRDTANHDQPPARDNDSAHATSNLIANIDQAPAGNADSGHDQGRSSATVNNDRAHSVETDCAQVSSRAAANTNLRRPRAAVNPTITRDGFSYIYVRTGATGTKFYRCSKHRPSKKRPVGCQANIAFNPEGTVKTDCRPADHNCIPIPEERLINVEDEVLLQSAQRSNAMKRSVLAIFQCRHRVFSCIHGSFE